MKLKRKALIVGGAVLFGMPACTGDSGEPDNPMDQGTIPRDSMASSDSTAGDSALTDDSSVEIDANTPEEDMAVPMEDAAVALDAEGPEPDAMVSVDGSVSPDLGTIADAMFPMDMAVVVPDAAVDPDQGRAGACADMTGMRCQPFTGCCEEGQPVLMCENGVLVAGNNGGFPCDCTVRDGVGEVRCAVPGFVGIHVANRRRVRAPRLRDLLG